MLRESLDRGFKLCLHVMVALAGLAEAWSGGILIAGEQGSDSVVSDQEAVLQQLLDLHLPRLGSNVRSERVEAEARLLEAGPALLEWLPPPGTAGDFATREALRRIRAELEQQAARNSVRPSRITLRETMTLTELVEQLALQSGNPVDLEADDDGSGVARLDVDYQNTRFWDVLSDLANRTRLRVVTGERIVLAPMAGEPAITSVTSGAFRVEVLSVRPRGGILALEFAVSAEPRLRPLFLSWSDADFAAHLSTHRELSPFSPEARRELPAVDRGPCRFSVVFDNPRREEESAADIAVSGNVVVTVAARTREFRFLDLTRRGSDSQRIGGVNVTRTNAEFSTTRRGVRRAEIELRVVYDVGGPAFESHRTWVYHNEVFLETPDGERLPVNDGFETLGEQNGAVAVKYRFRELPDVPVEDLQLVYCAPTTVIDVPVEFELDRLSVTVPDDSASAE